MEYYSVIKRNEILSIIIKQMNLEGMMINEIRQSKTNTVWLHFCIESKTSITKHKHEQL